MKEYRYHTDFAEDDPLLQHPLSAPILRGAHAAMEYAHEGEMRGKADPTIPYITHTMMVYDLLVSMRVRDPIVLSAALLHDALENCPEFRANTEALCNHLHMQMRKQGLSEHEADAVVPEIVELCRQVKNPDFRLEHKLVTQIGEIAHMSHAAKLIKIADQTASLMCNLMMPNDHTFKKHKAVAFAHKAHNLVRAICRYPTSVEDGKTLSVTAAQRGELDQLHKLFHEVHSRNADLLRASTPDKEARVRRAFASHLPKIFRDRIRTEASPQMPEPEVQASLDVVKACAMQHSTLQEQPELTLHGGISRVALNARGEVVRFIMWAAPDKAAKHPRNRMVQLFTDALAHRCTVHMDDSELHSVVMDDESRLREGRRFILDQPMKAKDFMEIATYACVISDEDAQRILRVSRDMYVNSVSQAYRPVDLSGRGDTPGR